MLPFEERSPDIQYKGLLREILNKGVVTPSRQGVPAITLIGPMPLRFKFENGFPMITERNMDPKSVLHPQWRQAIGEICAFINGARTQSELEKFGCYWWKDFVTEEKCARRKLETGDLGPGSYGAAFHDFPTSMSVGYNQWYEVIEEIKENPHLRTHLISPWIPYFIPRRPGKIQQVVVAPCHGWVHVRIIENKLTLHMWQRSGDVPLGVPNNIIQYAALTMMLAQVLGYEPYEFVHSFSDAHIFVNQQDDVDLILSRESRPFPTMEINRNVVNIFQFRNENFTLSDYNPHPGIKGIPVSI